MADLCLGTAQLGMEYGINNKVGKPNRQAARDILKTAILNGIKFIDTASLYGEAEEIIGEYLFRNHISDQTVKVIAKQCNSVDGLKKDEVEKSIRYELERTLNSLKKNFVDAYLLHSYREIDNAETIKILQKIKEEGLIKKIGVSVYEVDEAKRSMEIADIDYLQMPCSIFDQRGLVSGIFQKAKKNGITVFTRSAFLQGLLMMDVMEVPTYLHEIVPYLNIFNSLLQEYSLDKKHAIVKFILEETRIDYMVFGIETKVQLEEIIAEKKSVPLPKNFIEDVRKEFSNVPQELILPIKWKR